MSQLYFCVNDDLFYLSVFVVIHLIIVVLIFKKHTTTSVMAHVFQALACSFPVDGDGVVRIWLGGAAPHRIVDTVQHSVQSAASHH